MHQDIWARVVTFQRTGVGARKTLETLMDDLNDGLAGESNRLERVEGYGGRPLLNR